MRDRSLDSLFDRFRRRGDVAALATIFDRTAPEILRVAMSLVRDASEADDLLQETYLTAIERAPHYDASGRLQAWLVGILVHHAREQRRRRTRAIDPARLDVRPPSDPLRALESSEIDAELARAIEGLPERDRRVLAAHLRDGKSAAEIAAALGCAPGTVRMQIHRGLDRLRKLLPAGLALGAAAVVSGRGLAAVRANVLRAGTAAATHATATTGAGILGGLLVGKKILLASLAIGIAALLVWLSRPDAPRVASRAPAAAPIAARPSPNVPSEASPTREVPSVATPRARRPASFERALAGARGRLVEHDGAPVPGVDVALVSLRSGDVFASLPGRDAALFDPIAGTGTTDADGRFELRGSWAQAFHALGVDLGGPRSTLRVLETAFVPGEIVDLGDVRLPATAALVGRVVDESGQPVTGARVRAADVPDALLETGLTGVRTTDAFALDARGEETVLELPAWLAPFDDRLPVATTRTRADGGFALERVAAGHLSTVVDAAGFAALTLAPANLVAGERRDLGDATLRRGRTVRGRVVDARGEGVAGAEVLVGARARAGIAALHRVGRSDARGAFEAAGVGDGIVVAAARAKAMDRWTVAVSDDAARDLEIVLRPGIDVSVDVSDDRGEPVLEPEFALGYAGAEPLRPSSTVEATRDERVPGRHRLAGVAPGSYRLSVRARGCAVAATEIDVKSDAPPIAVVLSRARGVEVVARDERTREPIAAAEVAATTGENGALVALATTDANGRATLDAVPASGPAQVRVDHPGYARAVVPVASGADRIDVELGPGGGLAVRLRSSRPMERGYALTLVRDGDPPSEMPLSGALDSDGRAAFTHLAPGTWHWALHTAFGSAEPMTLLSPSFRRDMLRSGSIAIVAGEVAEIEIALDDEPAVVAPEAPGASFEGTVRVDGKPARGVSLLLTRYGESGSAPLVATPDADGAFAFPRVPSGRWVFAARRWESQGIGPANVLELHSETMEFVAGERRQVAFEWTTISAEVRVVSGADESPVAGATVALYPTDPRMGGLPVTGTTGDDGRAALVIAHPGDYAVRISAGMGNGRGRLHVDEDESPEPLTVVLSPGVECAGRVEIDESLGVGSGAFLILYRVDDPAARGQCALAFDGRQARFRIVGLEPGTYIASAFTGKGWTGPSNVELAPSGSASLDIDLPPPPKPADGR
jgi:RNA polymerase sigma factor (sigma-70 family)